jgi:dihydroorotate dehydrogenase electron transfer subunit
VNKNISKCIDINSKYCPCLLAETNQCIFCSHLKGETTCNCNWSGMCILYEKHWQHKNQNQLEESPKIRMEEEVNFSIKEQLSDTTYRLEMKVSDELAKQLTPIGSFVFLRCPNDPHYFYFPISIMKIKENILQVVIETIGPKTVRIFADNNNKIVIRGPYWNGVLGQPWIDNLTYGKIVLIAGGIGQAPALPLANKLMNNSNNQVMAILAPGKVGKFFIEEDLKGLGVLVHTVPSLRKFGLSILKEWLHQKPDVIVSAGADSQHYGIITAMQEAGVNVPMVATNNATMCCGEGICGSCLRKVQGNKEIRMCKQQTDFGNIIEY